MKNKNLLLLFFLSLFLINSQCKKHKPIDPLSQLPPETQTGANTFGCLVNGQAFVPKGPSLGPILSSYYQQIYSGPDGYVFQVAAYDKSHGDDRYSILLLGDSLKIIGPQTIYIKGKIKGNTSGAYYTSKFNGTIFINNDYFSTDLTGGELIIKKFDEINQIASGTFWFNALGNSGDTVKITNGRFDVRFTK